MPDANIVAELSVVDKYSEGLDKFKEKIEMTAREIEQIQPKISNPLAASPDAHLKELSDRRISQIANAVADLKGSPLNSYAEKVTELAPKIKRAREEQAKYKQDLESITGLHGKQLDLLAKIPLSYAAIAAAGAAFIFTAKTLTDDIRERAERRLKVEEQITAEMNKQILTQQNLLAEFEKRETLAAEDRQFDRSIAGYDLGQAQSRRDKLNEQLTYLRDQNKLVPNYADEDSLKQLEGQIHTLNALIDRLRNTPTTLNVTYSSNQKSLADELRERMDAQQKWNESVRQAQALVKSLGEELTNVIRGTFASDNPFARIFAETEDRIERIRKATRGFSQDLRSSLETVERQNAALAVTSQRMESVINAFNLRTEAANFRNPFDPEKLKEQQARWQRAFFHDNPNYLFRMQNEYDARKRDTRDPISLGYTSFEDFIQKDLNKRSKGLFDTPEARLNKQIEAQYDLLYSSRMTDRERALADRKFISLTQGVDPLKASDRVRDAAATARENEAVREENREREAQKLRRTQAEIQARMLTELEDLNKKGTTYGKQALEVLIKDDTESGVGIQQSQKQATPEDTLKEHDYLNYRGFNV